MTDWDDILDRHGPRVWRMAHRMLGNAHDADDCLQDVFLAAWEYSRSQPIRYWPAFLQVTLTNKALDRIRRRVRCPDPVGGPAADAGLASPEPTPEQQAQAAELADRLRWALTCLTDQEAQVFCLCCLEDFGHAEVAETLGINLNTAYARLRAARHDLEKAVKRVQARDGWRVR